MNYNSLPKVELHLHLDSSLSFETARRFDSSLTADKFNKKFIAPPKCEDLPDYLKRVARQVRLLQTPSQLTMATRDLIERLDNDRVLYAEIRFAPLLHTRKGLTGEEVVRIVSDAVTMSTDDADIKVKIILCTLRSFSPSQCMETARLVERFYGNNIAGLDVAGDEKGFSLEANIPAFEYLQKRDIPRTAHAGEAMGPESIWETIQKLDPSRIGHGVRSFEDPKLLDYLKDHNIHLEVCPTSNIQTDVYDSYEDHSIGKLHDKGISVGINTDGKTTSDVTLSREYEKLAKYFGWTEKEFLSCNLNALEAAFLPESDKKPLRERLAEGYGRAE